MQNSVSSAKSMRRGFHAKFLPSKPKEFGISNDKCLYGISLGVGEKRLMTVAAGLEWAMDRWSNCAILLGDGLYRITLQIQDELTEPEASQQAWCLGENVLKQLSDLVDIGNVRVFRSSSIFAQTDFIEPLNVVRQLWVSNDAFRKSVAEDACTFVRRQSQAGRLSIPVESAQNLSAEYLLEEVAVYLFLADRGWLIDVYLGEELPTLAKIASSKIKEVPVALTKRVNVALRRRS